MCNQRLSDNGGVLTHALIPGSPAINAGDPSFTITEEEPPWFDNRGYGYLRALYDRTDIGAYEFEVVSCDLNGDGLVGLADAVLALQVMAGVQADVRLAACLETPPQPKRQGFPISREFVPGKWINEPANRGIRVL